MNPRSHAVPTEPASHPILISNMNQLSYNFIDSWLRLNWIIVANLTIFFLSISYIFKITLSETGIPNLSLE